LTLGSVQPGAQVWSVGKDATNAITIGAVCVRDTATSPDSYKIATAGVNTGPFVVCVNKAAAATDTSFAAAFPGSFVTVKAQGAIEVGAPVYTSTTVAGSVSATASGDVVGRYMGHETELTGKTPGTAAADAETNIVIFIGGTS
jgi:hypothetical protein